MFSTRTNSGNCTASFSNSYPSSIIPTNRSTSGIYWTFSDDYQQEILGSVSLTFHPGVTVRSNETTQHSVTDCASLSHSYSSTGSYSGSFSTGGLVGSFTGSSTGSSSGSSTGSYSNSSHWNFSMNCSCGKTVSTYSYFS